MRERCFRRQRFPGRTEPQGLGGMPVGLGGMLLRMLSGG